MISPRRGLVILMVLAPLGLWGCAQEKNGAANTKIRDLAARNGKLEEDVRLATTTSDALRRKLAHAESQRADLAKQVAQLEDARRERSSQDGLGHPRRPQERIPSKNAPGRLTRANGRCAPSAATSLASPSPD